MLRYLVVLLFLGIIFANSQKSEEAQEMTSKMSALLDKKEKVVDIDEELFEKYKNYGKTFVKSANDHSLIQAYRSLLNSNIKIAKKEMQKINCKNVYSVDSLKYLPAHSCIFVGKLNLQKSGIQTKGMYKGSSMIVLKAKTLDIKDGILKYKSKAKGVYTFEYLGKITDKNFESFFISSIISSEIHNLLENETKNLTNDAKEKEQVSQDSNKAVEEMASKLKNTSQYIDYYFLLGRLKSFLKKLRQENDGVTDLIDIYASDAYFFNLLFAVSYKRSQKDRDTLLIYRKTYINNYKKAKSSYENYYKSLIDFNKKMQNLKHTKNYFSGLVLNMQNDAYEDILKNNKKIEIFNQDLLLLDKKYKIYNLNNKKLAKINIKSKPELPIQSEKNKSFYKKDIGIAYRDKYIYKEIRQNDKLKNFLIENADYSSGLHSGLYFGLHGNYISDINNITPDATYGGDFSLGYFYKNFALGFDIAGYGVDNLNYATFVDLKLNFSSTSFTGFYVIFGYGFADIKQDFSQNQFAKIALGFNIPLVRFGSVQSNVLGLDFNIGYLSSIDDLQNKLNKNKLIVSLGFLFSF